MTESGISRIGAATGVVSVVVTFIGFGVHGALPTDTTADAVETYVKGVSASQAGIGNYLELLGYLLFLAFAAYLYAVGRAGGTNSLHWLNVLGSFEIAALFLLAVGILLWTRPIALRLVGASGMLVGLVLFVTGLMSTASIQSSSSQIGYMVFSIWTLIAGIYLVIRPAPIARAA